MKSTSLFIGKIGVPLTALALAVASANAGADDNLKINGFLTTGVSWSDAQAKAPCAALPFPTLPSTAIQSGVSPNNCSVVSSSANPIQYTPYYDHITSTPSWDRDTILGLQLDYKIDDQSSMTAQLTSRGVADYQVKDEWAYATYKPTSNWQLRIGRQRIPFYMLSEQLDVGMSYPWARPPLELYSLPVNAYNGISTRYDFQLGSVSGNLNAMWGDAKTTSNSPYVPLGFLIKDARGFGFNMYVGDFTIRGATTIGNVLLDLNDDKTPGQMFNNLNSVLTLVGNPGVQRQKAMYSNLGVTYDDGSMLVMSEIGDLKYSQGILQDPLSGYLMFGYHFGSLMPHFTVAKSRTNTDGNQRRDQAITDLKNGSGALLTSALTKDSINGTLQQSLLMADTQALEVASASIVNQGMEQTSYTLGLRYDITPKMSAKVEATHVNSLNGGWGLFSDAPTKNGANIYTFVVNAMF